eukprot:188453-Chlamydomonas_euryale.AAC.2
MQNAYPSEVALLSQSPPSPSTAARGAPSTRNHPLAPSIAARRATAAEIAASGAAAAAAAVPRCRTSVR